MEPLPTQRSEGERQALLSLWAIPGIGPRAMECLERYEGGMESLLDMPPRLWMAAFPLSPQVRERLERVERLREIGERVRERTESAGIKISFAGEPSYPRNLVGIEDAPPLLFHRGVPGRAQPCAALVGSRHPEQGFIPTARTFAREVAEAGVCIVSGAAEGVDAACHEGALAGGAQTWAFVGCGLDQLDPAQAELLPRVLRGGGVFYSELPPGVRARKERFPRRNRLISGASEVVVILRAALNSGSRHTVLAALKQGRRLMALPGDPEAPASKLCRSLIDAGRASMCLRTDEVLEALGLPRRGVARRRAPTAEEIAALSADARRVYGAVSSPGLEFEEVLAATELPPATLTSALCELELRGLVVQQPGKRYERL
jgi:DNA processing protein